MELTNISKGLSAAFIKNSRFKASFFTVRFVLPLEKDTVTENAMAAELITDCCAKYPTPELLNKELNALYGADIGFSTEKLGDCQLITVYLKGVSNEYGINSEKCFTKAADILKNMLFSPNLKGEEFLAEDVNRVSRLWCDKINAEINDKRIFAKNKLESLMFSAEPYGIPRYGYLKNAQNATGKALKEAYERLINTAEIRMSFVGNENPEKLFSSFAEGFNKCKRESVITIDTAANYPEKVSEISEKLPVTQGKLVMGFRAGVSGDDRETYPLAVVTDLFGGGTYSKLFSVVREKMSLCYYCSARAYRKKGLVMVESGVDNKNAQKARDAILAQLEEIKNGKFTDDDLAASKRSICNSLLSLDDSINSIDYWYGTRISSNNPVSPADFSALITGVDRDMVVEYAKKIKPDTFYFLLADGGEQNV